MRVDDEGDLLYSVTRNDENGEEVEIPIVAMHSFIVKPLVKDMKGFLASSIKQVKMYLCYHLRQDKFNHLFYT